MVPLWQKLARRLFGKNPVARKVWGRIKPTVDSQTRQVFHQREIYRRAMRAPLRTGTVLYECYAGKGLVCNPAALFRHLMSDPRYSQLHHVIVLNQLTNYPALQQRYRDEPRVTFVAFRSDAYFTLLGTAEFLVNNVTFPPEFCKRAGQRYLNTWHGVPMKQMGYLVPNGEFYSRNVVRNFLHADLLLSANSFMTEKMYLGAYKLGNVFGGRIIEYGSPRIDHQIASRSRRTQILDEIRSSGTDLRNGCRYIVYAPTWRGSSIYAPDDPVGLVTVVRQLNVRLAEDNIQILLRPHQSIEQRLRKRVADRGLLISSEVDTNALLSVVDGLITDFSSIYFDFLVERKPIFLFLPDREGYAQTQGLLLDPGERAAQISEDLPTLAREIRSTFAGGEAPSDARTFGDLREFCPHEDGRASARVAELLINGHESADHPVLAAPRDGRHSVLIYGSALQTNGITTALTNLLNHLDHKRFDVTLIHLPPDRQDRANLAKLTRQVRLVERVGGINVTRAERAQWERLLFDRPNELIDGSFGADIARSEWQRCFGDTTFSTVIDYQGYAPFWSVIFAHGRADHLSIWQHNDLDAERRKRIGGVARHERSLNALFQLYPRFDSVVAVSASLAEINRSKLAIPGLGDRLTSAVNMIDADLTRWSAGLRPTQAALGGAEPVTLTGMSPYADFRRLRSLYDLEDLRQGFHQQVATDRWLRRRDAFTFITVGRLSPEKNHVRLINAFAAVHESDPRTQLIIVGSGPLEAELGRLVQRLGLASAVTLTGHLPNPHRIVVAADCFVLSSDHEGQPLALLEAMVLSRAIVTTDFDTVHGAIREDQGLIVERSVEGLANGMRIALAGGVPAAAFDDVSYNARALGEFLRATRLDEVEAHVDEVEVAS